MSLAKLKEMRVRVYRFRDARLLDPACVTMPRKISVCEGGCLYPAHPSLALVANRILLNPVRYTPRTSICSAANFRIGWACGPEPVIRQMRCIGDQTVTEYPLVLQGIGGSADGR